MEANEHLDDLDNFDRHEAPLGQGLNIFVQFNYTEVSSGNYTTTRVYLRNWILACSIFIISYGFVFIYIGWTVTQP
jgi:hypothetical protein